MSTDTLTLADKYAYDLSVSIIDWTEDDLLEVSYDHEAAMWCVLITYGGPTAIITGDPFSLTGVLLHVRWGSDRTVRPVHLPWLAEMLAAMPAPDTH